VTRQIDNKKGGDAGMLGSLLRVVSGPLGVAISVTELVMAASKVIDALQDEDEEDA